MNEVDKFLDFMARELIDMVKKECGSTMQDPNDKGEIKDICKCWLEAQDLKKRLWKRIKFHLKE